MVMGGAACVESGAWVRLDPVGGDRWGLKIRLRRLQSRSLSWFVYVTPRLKPVQKYACTLQYSSVDALPSSSSLYLVFDFF
jgi:hypothetical protein